jgi:hypothetical protein
LGAPDALFGLPNLCSGGPNACSHVQNLRFVPPENPIFQWVLEIPDFFEEILEFLAAFHRIY